MKIVQLKTYMGVRAGTTRAETNFTTDAHSLHKGLSMTPHAHELLGPGVMIETSPLKEKKRITFVPINNVEEIVFGEDDKAAPLGAAGKAKK